MINRAIRFEARPSNGAVTLCIEFGDDAQVTMALELAEVEELLRAIDGALGTSNNGGHSIVPVDH
ncbi:hypothetical protein [Microvirga arabica]|uniref:hypothetical protein n=1 Tax=Microvirga arabica TaxID=1128671 RepID=UPI0019396E8F|nr:hypothetical protein [Microvirga arabica]MBM1170009.1 hypothetical protein [Microvirga arabica]